MGGGASKKNTALEEFDRFDANENGTVSFREMSEALLGKKQVAGASEEARKLLKEEEVDLIITDQRMPQETGVEFLESIIPIYPKPIRLLLTGYTDIQAVIDAINKGQVYHYLTKPWEEDYLRTVIKNAFEIYMLRRENEKLTEALLKANEQLEFLLRQNLLS